MPEVLAIGPADCERVAAFLASVPVQSETMSVEAWLARLRSWWDYNPSFTEDCTRGWILCEAGVVVGFVGAIPMKFLAGGVETTAVASTTWRVLPKHRGMSMAFTNRRLTAYPNAVHFSTNPSLRIEPMLKLLRYQPFEKWREGQTQSVVVLNITKFVRDKFKRGIVRAIRPVLPPLARLAQALALWRLWRCNTANVCELSKADVAFDDLWARTRHLYQNTNVRTAAIIHWYCFTIMPADKKLLGYFREGRLLGFMILWIEQDSDLRVAYCVDLWFDPSEDELEIVGALVSQAVKWAGRQGLDRVVFPHFHRRTAACYALLGLPQRPAWKRREFIFAPGQLLASMTPENTYLVRAQGEIGL
jgi:hypothetical protein